MIDGSKQAQCMYLNSSQPNYTLQPHKSPHTGVAVGDLFSRHVRKYSVDIFSLRLHLTNVGDFNFSAHCSLIITELRDDQTEILKNILEKAQRTPRRIRITTFAADKQ
jgi:hypothetical protein